MFFNELDLLEFRLTLLNEHVTHFVIAESNITHSGQSKPYHFEENKKRFDHWLHKITYLKVKQTTNGLDFSTKGTSYNPKSAAFNIENEHRNTLSVASSIANDEDLILISDLDEIPNPFSLKNKSLETGPVAFSMLFHYYFFNCQNVGAERWWNGSILCTGKQFKHTTPQLLRDNRNIFKRVRNAGWHFSYLGGVEKIKQKIQSFAHTELNREEYLSDTRIRKALEEGNDIFNRPDAIYKFVSVYYYPDFLRTVMEQYPAFIYVKKKDGFYTRLFYSLKRIFS